MRTFLIVSAVLFFVGRGSPASAEEVTYVVAVSKSSLQIEVGKAGLFSFAGHRHKVEAPVTGTINADTASLARSSVDLTFASAQLRVWPDGEPEGDAQKVEEVMHGARVLDVIRFPEIRFRSVSVAGQEGANETYELKIEGELSLHGVTKRIMVPVTVKVEEGSITATGKTSLRHDQFGMKPVRAVGGTIKVANEIKIGFKIVAEKE